jgi:hypothetical protein
MRSRRLGEREIRDSDLFTETLDRFYDLQYVFDLFHSCQLSPPGDVVSVNLSDDVGGSGRLPTCADVRADDMAPNVESAEGNSRFSGF